jgi:hypothetical protein
MSQEEDSLVTLGNELVVPNELQKQRATKMLGNVCREVGAETGPGVAQMYVATPGRESPYGVVQETGLLAVRRVSEAW